MQVLKKKEILWVLDTRGQQKSGTFLCLTAETGPTGKVFEERDCSYCVCTAAFCPEGISKVFKTTGRSLEKVPGEEIVQFFLKSFLQDFHKTAIQYYSDFRLTVST